LGIYITDGKASTSGIRLYYRLLQRVLILYPLTLKKAIVVLYNLFVFLPKARFKARTYRFSVPAIKSLAVYKENRSVIKYRIKI